jgi:mRNA-degrading endonuclease RelE of RelBE toxin-antitoxin system
MPELSRRAEKDLASLPEALQDKARALITKLDVEPALGKKLLGPLRGKRSVWLGRSHRIIYQTDPVFVIAIPPRRDAYR